MAQRVYLLHIVSTPKIISYDPANEIMIMDAIPQMNISDMYGEEPEDVREGFGYIFDEIRRTVRALLKHEIIYPDITGYNFIQWGNKVWIIDFEHCAPLTGDIHPFVLAFLKGANEWNPDFR